MSTNNIKQWYCMFRLKDIVEHNICPQCLLIKNDTRQAAGKLRIKNFEGLSLFSRYEQSLFFFFTRYILR